MKYAYEQGVILRADNGANLNDVKDSVLEGLVRYKFGSMTCSLDGAGNKSYRIYRVGGDFDAVIRNVRKINQLKEQARSEYPRLAWQFVVFGHNEHEIESARSLAGELNMQFNLKLSWDEKFSPPQDQNLVRKEIGAASRREFKEKHGFDYVQGTCHQLWDEPQINWDGKLLGCCRNFWGDFGGNAFRDGLLNSINRKEIEYARGMLLGKHPAKDGIPCTTCSMYLDMQADGHGSGEANDSLVPEYQREIKKLPPPYELYKRALSVYRYLLSLIYIGNNRECPFCGGHFPTFLPTGLDIPVLKEKSVVGDGYRLNSTCPTCHSIDR